MNNEIDVPRKKKKSNLEGWGRCTQKKKSFTYITAYGLVKCQIATYGV